MDVELKLQTADPLHVQIQRRLEAMIQSGELSPGERIPPTKELVAKWGVHSVAVQKAMAELVAAGLIERKSGRGTFVRSSAHKAIVGVLVGFDLLDESGHFYRAVVREVQREIQGRGCRAMYYDRLAPTDDSRVETLQHLRHDLRDHRFSGFVLLGHRPELLENDKVRTDLPSVAFFPASSSIHKPDVELDYYDFTYSACAYLARSGRKRVTYLRPFCDEEYTYTRDVDGFTDCSKAHQLEVGPASVCQFQRKVLPAGEAIAADAHAKMLECVALWKRTKQMPDGLIVMDDIVMRGVARALWECGIKAPEQLEIVCAANQGIEHLYHVPVTRYEFSPCEIARQLISVLWKQMTDKTAGELPVRIRGEIKASST